MHSFSSNRASVRLHASLSRFGLAISMNIQTQVNFVAEGYGFQTAATAKHYSVGEAVRGERSLLSPLFFWAVGPSALPCAGAPPPQRPRSKSRRSECESDTKLASRGGQYIPPSLVLAGSECVPVQARQAKQRPYMPNVHRYDHRESATETLTVQSAQTDRTQYIHRTWLGSYNSQKSGLGLLRKRSNLSE